MAYSLWQEREGIGWFVLFVSFLWLNQTNQRNEMKQINPVSHERRTGRRRPRAVYLVCEVNTHALPQIHRRTSHSQSLQRYPRRDSPAVTLHSCFFEARGLIVPAHQTM